MFLLDSKVLFAVLWKKKQKRNLGVNSRIKVWVYANISGLKTRIQHFTLSYATYQVVISLGCLLELISYIIYPALTRHCIIVKYLLFSSIQIFPFRAHTAALTESVFHFSESHAHEAVTSSAHQSDLGYSSIKEEQFISYSQGETSLPNCSMVQKSLCNLPYHLLFLAENIFLNYS